MNKSELTKKLESAVEFFKHDIAQVRTGRANPNLIEELNVDAYGSVMKVKELGTISVPEPQMIVVSPWDKGTLSAIDKAIRNSDLKLNPVSAEGILRIPIPPLSEERRLEFSKLVGSKTETARQSLRNIRQDALKAIDKMFADKQISEDEKFTQREEVEKLIKDYTNIVNELGETKKDQILEIA